MKSRLLSFLTLACLLLSATIAQAVDIRLKVKNKSLGSKTTGETRKSQRQLNIEIDNRDREAYEGVTIEWTIIARDIRNRKLSIAGTGSKDIDIPANDEMEINSGPYSLSKTEGKVEQIEQNRNNPNAQQFKVDPDTGTRYAGYIVVIKKDGEVIAEAATAGMKKRIAALQKGKKKK